MQSSLRGLLLALPIIALVGCGGGSAPKSQIKTKDAPTAEMPMMPAADISPESAAKAATEAGAATEAAGEAPKKK